MASSSCQDSKAMHMNASNSWAFVVVFTLIAMALASVFSFIFTRNVTESQRVLHEMRTQQQELMRLEQLVEILPGGVALVDVETGTIVDCNEGFRTLTGRPSSSLIGHSIIDVIPEEYRPQHRKSLIDETEETWAKYGNGQFTLQNGKWLHNDKGIQQGKVIIRGTQVDGRREWMVFIDPRVSQELSQ